MTFTPREDKWTEAKDRWTEVNGYRRALAHSDNFETSFENHRLPKAAFTFKGSRTIPSFNKLSKC